MIGMVDVATIVEVLSYAAPVAAIAAGAYAAHHARQEQPVVQDPAEPGRPEGQLQYDSANSPKSSVSDDEAELSEDFEKSVDEQSRTMAELSHGGNSDDE